MIAEGEAAIPLETTLHAFRNQEKTKQRSTIVSYYLVSLVYARPRSEVNDLKHFATAPKLAKTEV